MAETKGHKTLAIAKAVRVAAANERQLIVDYLREASRAHDDRSQLHREIAAILSQLAFEIRDGEHHG